MKKYFAVNRYRQYIDTDYVREFLREEKHTKLYDSLDEATKRPIHDLVDTDDSDYGIFSIDDKNNIKRHN